MGFPVSAVELIALASSISLLAGWRLYLVTFATGLAMKYGWIDLPERLQALDVLANNWIIGIAAGAIRHSVYRIAAGPLSGEPKLPWPSTSGTRSDQGWTIRTSAS